MKHLSPRTLFTTLLTALALSCALTFATGCEPITDALTDTCSMDEGTAVVSGRWVISGDGDRHSCADSALEGEFGLGPSTPINISQPGNATKINQSSSQSGFALDGTVNGSCVSFETEESWNGKTLIRRYSGTVSPGGSISGTFTGSGPDGCQSSGNFIVEID